MQSRRWLIVLLLGALALFPMAAHLHADDIGNAQQQLKEVTARRAAAEQRLAQAKQETAQLNAQLQTNARQLTALQQQNAGLQAQANKREAALTSDLSSLLSQLEAARQNLNAQQAAYTSQQTAAQQRLASDQGDLRSAQAALRQTDQQRADLNRDATALAAQLQTMDADIGKRNQEIASVLVQLYKLSQTSALNLVLSASSVSDGLNRLTMLGMVSQHDQNLLTQLSNERDLAARQHQALADELTSVQQLQAELDSEQAEIRVRSVDEQTLIQQLETQIADAQHSFQQQAAGLDAAIATTKARIDANRRQLVADKAPLIAKQTQLSTAQQQAQTQLTQAKQAQASAEEQIASAERDQAAATRLIQQLQAAAAARAAAARAAAEAAAKRNAAQAAPPSSGRGFIWPLHGVITQGFGPTSWTMEPPGYGYAHFHTGVDIAAAYGSPIVAAAGGVVIHTGWLGGNNWGYGDCIIIVIDNQLSTLYGHLSGVAVGANQIVRQGQVIGYEGSTGNSSGPHLHFEVRVNGNPVNPFGYL